MSTPAIGTRLRVWFPDDNAWYVGTVSASTRGRGTQVKYDQVEGEDDLVKWHKLAEWKFELIDGSSSAGQSSKAAGKARAVPVDQAESRPPAVSSKAAGKARMPPAAEVEPPQAVQARRGAR